MTAPEAMAQVARVLADGRVMVGAVREASRSGQWSATAEMLERWADRVENAVTALGSLDLSDLDEETLERIRQTVASAARMHALVTGAANDAWARAAAAGGARA